MCVEDPFLQIWSQINLNLNKVQLKPALEAINRVQPQLSYDFWVQLGFTLVVVIIYKHVNLG